MNHCYILYSKKLERFYIGACHSDLRDRIYKHNDHAYGAHRYTAKANDWELYLAIECQTFSMARRIELHIKKILTPERKPTATKAPLPVAPLHLCVDL